jgi:hypothetical protein
MAKYSQASENIENLVVDISNELGLINYGVDFQPLCVNKAKEVCKIVKANELAEYASNREDLVFVLCYEDAFDLVDEKTQYMWLRMEMEKVAYDTEKDKMVLGCPQITVPVGVYEKYKEVAVDAALLGQYTIAQIKEKEKEEAAQRKALKTKGAKKR